MAPAFEALEDPSWYFDSGATNHITNNACKLLEPKLYIGAEKLLVGTGHSLHIEHIGLVLLTTIMHEPLCFKYVLHVPNITKNLLSISQLLSDNNVIVEFFKSLCYVKARNIGVILLKGVVKGSLYQVQTFSHQSQNQTTLLSQSFASKIESLFASFPTSLSVNTSVLNH